MKLKSLLLANAVLLGCMAAHAHAEDEAQLIKKGEYLSRLGDCMACHSVAGKPDYAGGLAIESNLGTIYSTNITPDKEHGIGNYSEQQFSDAVRKGVLPDGSRLYPAMPYPDYAKISDEDMHALYLYFMKGVQPSADRPPETRLSFPFSSAGGCVSGTGPLPVTSRSSQLAAPLKRSTAVPISLRALATAAAAIRRAVSA
ncbi:cytochrome c [Pantoea tagorei]